MCASTRARSSAPSLPFTYQGSSNWVSWCGSCGSRMMLLIACASQPVRQLTGQLGLEVAAGVEHARLHRVHGAGHQLGDLAIVELVEIGEINDRAMVGRQLVDGSHQRLLALPPPDLQLRSGLGAFPDGRVLVFDRLVVAA